MSALASAEESLRGGDAQQALKLLQADVRARPQDSRLRVFLFQLLCILGQWERALGQLEAAATLDPAALAMKYMYGDAIRCELLRTEVFRGIKSPMIFGQPEPWLALLIEALLRLGRGEKSAAMRLREQGFDQAPESSGTIDDIRFAWISDCDMRLGPVLEAIVNGRYYWVPFTRLSRVELEKPADLRDAVWIPAHLQFENGGDTVALVPTRYPGSEASDDGLVALARKTLWEEIDSGVYVGFGQRVITTDAGEYPLLDVRTICFDSRSVAGKE